MVPFGLTGFAIVVTRARGIEKGDAKWCTRQGHRKREIERESDREIEKKREGVPTSNACPGNVERMNPSNLLLGTAKYLLAVKNKIKFLSPSG